MPDLLLKVKINKECQIEARREFKRKYTGAFFSISGEFVNDDKTAVQKTGYHMFNIKNFNIIKNMLNIFGDLIQNVQISFEYIKVDEGKEIVKYLNEHCIQSLMSLVLLYCKENVLDDLKNIFPNVNSVKFSSDPMSKLKIASNSPKINVTFPNVKILELKYTAASDWVLIGDRFPRITSLHVELPERITPGRPDDTHVINLLKKNPKITTLSIRHINLKILNAASQYLLQPKNLQIRLFSNDYTNDNNEHILFESVRYLTIESTHSKEKIPKNIILKQLRELKMDVQPEFTDKWIRFIRNQLSDSIRKFELKSDTLKNEHLRNISEALPNVRMASIECTTNLSAEAIFGFIEQNKHLKRIDLRIKMEEFEQKQLQIKLQTNWDIDYGLVDDNMVEINLMGHSAVEVS